MNKINKNLYFKFKEQHLEDGGMFPDAYAITELIKEAIINKNYIIYAGGGYETNTNKRIELYDVVVWFNFGGDAFFQICIDNSDGDFCTLVNSNNKCEILKTIK